MLQDLMNMEGVAVLSKQQQSAINGGDGPCRVFYRDANGNALGWSEETTSVAIAQGAYNMQFTVPSSGSYVSGYCCASCK
jgi:hypothetical protein